MLLLPYYDKKVHLPINMFNTWFVTSIFTIKTLLKYIEFRLINDINKTTHWYNCTFNSVKSYTVFRK